jgi:type I site-specific restriction endonuclease
MPRGASGSSEAGARRDLIDRMLRRQGWSIVPYVPGRPTSAYIHHAVTEYPTANGPADYALFVGGILVGIIEAKRLSLGPQNVLVQAERYSRGATDSLFNFRGFRVPFLYDTNGKVIWFHDIRHALNCSRRIAGFHTPAALAQMLNRNFEEACARESRREGFAEFGALALTNPILARRAFPRCWAVWRERCLDSDEMAAPNRPTVAAQPLSTSDATPSIAATAADGATAA